MTEITRFFIDQRSNLIRSPKIRLRRKELSILSSDTAETAFLLEEFCQFASINTINQFIALGTDGLRFGYKTHMKTFIGSQKSSSQHQ